MLGYRIDLYFRDCKLAIEIGENDHCDRNIEYEIKRKKAIVHEFVCELFGLILTKKALKFLKLSMKYLDTSNKRLINWLKKDW